MCTRPNTRGRGRAGVKSDGEPVLNPDLWQELVRLKRRAGRVEFRHVKAHKTNPHNKAVDKLAKESADLASEPMRAAPMVARRRSSRKTEPGAVPIEGQTETIRIVSVRGIRGQPHHVYKYEIVGEESPHVGVVDDVFAANDDFALRRNHIYEVRFSEAARDAGSRRCLARSSVRRRAKAGTARRSGRALPRQCGGRLRSRRRDRRGRRARRTR